MFWKHLVSNVASKCFRGIPQIKPLTALISTSSCVRVKDDRKIWQKSLPKPDFGTQEISVDPFSGGICEFPDLETESKVYDGQIFSDIPVLVIHVSRNNTKYFLHDVKGGENKIICHRSCGYDGFKNCRKGTNVAAKTTALSFTKIMNQKGVNTVRVCVKGLGPGRLASIEGLTAAGVNIVSITDITNYTTNPPRPRKARRL